MGRAALQSDLRESPLEPDDNAEGRHPATALRRNDVFVAKRLACPGLEGLSKFRVHGYRSARALLSGLIVQGDRTADVTLGIEDHRPGQVGDLAGPQAGL